MGKVIVGIDYGSKTSGFTCAAIIHDGSISVHQATKNKDADKWLKELLEPLKPNVIGIDLPYLYRVLFVKLTVLPITITEKPI